MAQTLENVLLDLTLMSADRGVIVRPAQPEREAAVCVIMTSRKALRQLGKPLIEVVKSLGNDTFKIQSLDEKIRLPALSATVDSSPNGWCWGKFKFFELEVNVWLFCRSLEIVAKVCSDNGAPCSLNRKRAAEGWVIDKVLDRRQ